MIIRSIAASICTILRAQARSCSGAAKTAHHCQRAQSLVELALVLPILVFTLAAVLDISLAFYSYAGVGNAVRQGVRYGTMWSNCNDNNGIRSYVVASSMPPAMIINDESHIVVSAVQSVSNATAVPSGSCTPGNFLTVEARYDYVAASPLISLVAPNGVIPLVISASSIVD